MSVGGTRSAMQNCNAATAVIHMEYSLAKGKIISSVQDEESSWGKFNHKMMLSTFHLRFILRNECYSFNVSKWYLIDPIWSKWCMSLDLLAHVLCACIFKDERVIVYKWVSVVMCEVASVLQSKSIKLLRDVATGPILSLTKDHMSTFPGLWWYPMIQMQELL